MLHFYDFLLTVLHLAIIAVNLFGWIWQRTRKLHLYVTGLTLFCWLILGIWFGFGYCPVTDWQWTIKTKLGATRLPASFIKYFADKITGLDINAMLIDVLTAAGFGLAIVMAVYYNFIKRNSRL